MKKLFITLVIPFLFLTGCFNLATPPSQISGSYTSELQYQNFTCEQLSAELSSLARRENQLATAQEQRRKSSMVQAFWIGYGNGDGIEAAELANVRGEKEAVRKAIESNRCGASKNFSAKSATISNSSQPAGPLNDDLRRDLETIEQWRSAGILTEKEAGELRREALQKY
jgi:hypothetical protein